MQLSHEQLWELTPAEFLDLYEGWKWREEREMKKVEMQHDLELRRLALLAHWLNAPHLGKKNPKPTHYYNPDKDKEPKKTTQKESQAVVNDLAQEMGVEM